MKRKAIFQVLLSWGKTFVSALFIFVLLFLIVGSFVYYCGTIGESFADGRLMTVSELDGLGDKAIFYEKIMFWTGLLIWTILALSYFRDCVKKHKVT